MSTPSKDQPANPSAENHEETENQKNQIKLTEPTKEPKKGGDQKKEEDASKKEEKDAPPYKREFTIPRPRD
jgi:hypothetical protein